MPYDPLAAPCRRLEKKAADIAAMKREDYRTLRDFRAALSRRVNGVRQILKAIEHVAQNKLKE